MNQFPSSSLTSVVDVPVSETGTFFAPPWIRLGARLFATSLDEKLASGQHPVASHLLAARAQQLMAAQYRRGISDSWLNLLIEVRRPHTRFDPAVPLVRSNVIEAEGQIRSLAEALASPLPTVRGVAMAVAMLRDGAGPLFNRDSQLKLTDAVEEIIAQMNPLATATTL
jgi:hypothetical protein